MKISIFGTGYVGLVTGVCFAEHGHSVICADIDAAKIDILKTGKSPIFELGLEDLLQKKLNSENLNFTTNIAGAIEESNLLFIAVGAPTSSDSRVDLSSIMSLIDQINELATSPKIIIIKSTVPVGTYQEIKSKIFNTNLKLCLNPEFLREGSALQDCLHPHRVLIGTEDKNIENTMLELYRPFVENPQNIITTDPASCELSKYAANAMLATRIGFINELSRLCEKVGANIQSVEHALGLDPRIGPFFLQAGLGYGGSCLPKDLRALLSSGEQNGVSLDILSSVEKNNDEQRHLFLKKIEAHFQSLDGLRFAIWGTAFKPNTDDVREAPALYLIEQLIQKGASVKVFDPQAIENTKIYFSDKNKKYIHYAESPFDALQNADALILATEWDIFKSPDFIKIKTLMKNPIVFDGRNIYSRQNLSKLNFTYYGVGL